MALVSDICMGIVLVGALITLYCSLRTRASVALPAAWRIVALLSGLPAATLFIACYVSDAAPVWAFHVALAVFVLIQAVTAVHRYRHPAPVTEK